MRWITRGWSDDVRLLMSIVAGRTVQEVAADCGVAAEVLRTRLARVYGPAQGMRADGLPVVMPDRFTPEQSDLLRLAFRSLARRASVIGLAAVAAPLAVVLAVLSYLVWEDGWSPPAIVGLVGIGLAGLLLFRGWFKHIELLRLHAEDADTRFNTVSARARDALLKLSRHRHASKGLRDQLNDQRRVASEAIEASQKMAQREGELQGRIDSQSERIVDLQRKLKETREKLLVCTRENGRKLAIEEQDARRLLARTFIELHGGEWRSHVAARHDKEVVLFADVCGFTQWASDRAPGEIAQAIDDLVDSFDKEASYLGMARIKVIGDEFLIVSRLFEDQESLARKCASAINLANLMLYDPRLQLAGLPWKFGMASGPIASAMLSRDVSSIDIWGTTVNRAARLIKTLGLANTIVVCPNTWTVAKGERAVESFDKEEVQATLKGLGSTTCYRLHREGQAGSLA